MSRRGLLSGLAAAVLLALAGCGKKGRLEPVEPEKKKKKG